MAQKHSSRMSRKSSTTNVNILDIVAERGGGVGVCVSMSENDQTRNRSESIRFGSVELGYQHRKKTQSTKIAFVVAMNNRYSNLPILVFHE